MGSRPGIPDSLQDSESMYLDRLPPIESLQDIRAPRVIFIHDVVALRLLDTGSRDAMRALLPDSTTVLVHCIPTVMMLVAPSSTGAMVAGFFREFDVLRSMPPHPNVIGPPVAYLSRVVQGQKVLCGYALRWLPGGCIRDIVEEAGDLDMTPLPCRVKWATQIAAGLHHIHSVGHTYHGDVKLDNVVLDEDDNAVLIDFEQGRANEEAVAPELKAGYSVELSQDGRRLCYKLPASGADSRPL
ncbi:hypothetical protein BD309DRAFT_967732 [Dichomitus squalens]|nr:hypothetical protein BD309DRAFT_967732 [Dichomitus squalens]